MAEETVAGSSAECSVERSTENAIGLNPADNIDTLFGACSCKMLTIKAAFKQQKRKPQPTKQTADQATNIATKQQKSKYPE